MSTGLRSLGPNGAFARDLSWFAVRQCQMEMAELIEQTIESQQNALLESGTGTGKTFAYLVPPLLFGKKTLISTRTKHLQEQLFQKDIPVVCKTLDLKPEVRMLKGRANYLCMQLYDRAQKAPDMYGFSDRVKRVYDWVMERGNGDISEYGLPEDERRMMTVTAQTCIGSKCEFWKPCFANRARQEARKADVLVVNHDLLSLGVAHSDPEDDSSITSGFDVIIVDEAHRFPEIACQSLGIVVSKERIDEFCRLLESSAESVDLDPLLIASVAKSLTETAVYLSQAIDVGQMSLEKFQECRNLTDGYWKMIKILEQLSQTLEPHIEISPEIETCRDQALRIVDDAETIFERDQFEVASWCETGKRGFSINRLPLQPGKVFGPAIEEFKGSWIFTSATMAVGNDFSHFEQSMGIKADVHQRWESPFDFEQQTLLYFPPGMPLPNAPSREEYDRRVAQIIEKTAPLTQGRILALFTSIASMKAARDYLAERVDFTLLCQFDRSNTQLLDDFTRDGNAILLGTMGFWEGVDIKGDSLVCVIIDKLPFAPFDNPKENVRRSLMVEKGMDFFNDWQVPNAVLTLKQGSGRLIRDSSDRGLLVLCDPRIKQKLYGRKFLESLPPMPRTDSMARIREFFST